MCPQPSAADVHVDGPLTNVSVAYVQDQSRFIADQVFPIVPVNKQSDRYFVYDKGDFNRDEAEERAPSSESAGSGYALDNTPSYYCPIVALHKDIDDNIRANADSPLDMDRDATQFLTQKMLIKREKQFKAGFFTTSIWTGSSTGGDITPTLAWDVTGSDPVNDVMTQVEALSDKSTYMPNVLVITPKVLRALKSNASILDRIKYTQRGVITTELLAGLFEVDKVVVARASENTAKKGQTAVMANIFGTGQALLVYAAPGPSLMQPSGGYIFSWKGLEGSNNGWRVSRLRADLLKSDRIEIESAYAMKQVAADCGAFFTGLAT